MKVREKPPGFSPSGVSQERLAGRLWLADGIGSAPAHIPKPYLYQRQSIMDYIWKLKLHRVSLPPEFKGGEIDAS